MSYKLTGEVKKKKIEKNSTATKISELYKSGVKLERSDERSQGKTVIFSRGQSLRWSLFGLHISTPVFNFSLNKHVH